MRILLDGFEVEVVDSAGELGGGDLEEMRNQRLLEGLVFLSRFLHRSHYSNSSVESLLFPGKWGEMVFEDNDNNKNNNNE